MDLKEGIMADIMNGVNQHSLKQKPYKPQTESDHIKVYTKNKLFFCETCKKVWENITLSKQQRSLIFCDFPSYGLKRKECSYCKEANMYWTCSECEKQVDERFYDLDERICDDCNTDKSSIDEEEEVQFFSHAKSDFDFKRKKGSWREKIKFDYSPKDKK